MFRCNRLRPEGDKSIARSVVWPRSAATQVPANTSDRVAPGRYRPGAPTDPYVLALEHTVPQIRDSLRVTTHPRGCYPLLLRGHAGRMSRHSACFPGAGP